MENLKIKPSLIGSKVYHKILNRMILIEKGKEDQYEKLGMDVFTKRRTPKLQTSDKITKRRSNNNRSNAKRVGDDK